MESGLLLTLSIDKTLLFLPIGWYQKRPSGESGPSSPLSTNEATPCGVIRSHMGRNNEVLLPTPV